MVSLIIRGVVSIHPAIDISAGLSDEACLVHNPSRDVKYCCRELIRHRKCISRGHLFVCRNASAEATRSGLHGAANRLSLKSGGRAKGFSLNKQCNENESRQEIKATTGEHVFSTQGYFDHLMEEVATRKYLKSMFWDSLDSPQNGSSTVDLTSSENFVNIEEERLSSVKQDDVEYYIPKVGDAVIGVVVSGNNHKLDIDVGSAQLGRMLIKDAYPLDKFRSDDIFWETPAGDVSELPLYQVRIGYYKEALKISTKVPMVEVGSVLSLLVVGVSLSGRPLLSAKKFARRIAWQRVRQMQKQREPFEAQSVEWTCAGLIYRIEGLRAILPTSQFLLPQAPSALKDLVGERTYVVIKEVNEAGGKLILSEKEAWASRNLQLGSLVNGTVLRILPYGVEVKLIGTSLRAMVHISNISAHHVVNITRVFSVGEKVKAVVVKSPIPSRIALSTAVLESCEGLILLDKERVFREAEEMAAHFQSYLPNLEEEQEEEEDEVGIDEEPNVANLEWLDFGQQ